MLLIREAHAWNLHVGTQLTLFYLRQTNLMPGGLSAVKKLHLSSKFKELVNAFTTGQQINWLAIPPQTPHFEGLWEAAMKCIKRPFNRTVGVTNLSFTTFVTTFVTTFENFTTFVTQIEVILNSRPLTAPSSDANDPSALTTAPFFIGRPRTTLPEPSQEDNRILNRRFKSSNNIVTEFWKKWTLDYLTTLQHRPKWHNNKQQYAFNDIVIIKKDITPPMLWLLARTTKIFDGNDKIVRVVQVRTQTGLYIRSVSRIVPLEKENQNLSCSNGRQRMTQWMRIDKTAEQPISIQQDRTVSVP